jgi:predicted PurR-regulated permease PerM
MSTSKDFKDFFALGVILAIGFGLFWIFNYNRQVQMAITVGLGITYVVWGSVHHARRRELHWRVVLEYSTVAIIACLLVVYLLSRA